MQASRAQRNWQRVRNLFLKKTIKNSKAQKYRLFKKQKQIYEAQGFKCNVCNYKVLNIQIVTNSPIADLETIKKQTWCSSIDTTGTWVWQAQEILTYFIVYHEQRYRGDKVLELGAGSSGLAALTYSKLFQNSFTLITDGREQNIPFLERSIQSNGVQDRVKSKHLLWGSQLQNSFDLILLSDCLFFQNFHKDLIATLQHNLRKSGKVILVNPKRGKSMKNFLILLQENGSFEFQFLKFDDKIFVEKQKSVTQSQKFNEDQDLFYFIQINWKKSSSRQQLQEHKTKIGLGILSSKALSQKTVCSFTQLGNQIF